MKEFKIGKVKEYLEEIENRWNCDYGSIHYSHGIGKNNRFYLELHTGGWLENEEIIEELIQSFFWVLFWQKSERGGHYYFKGHLHDVKRGCL